jgi:hypothetical protein
MRSSATARAESCAASWTPACAILMICFAIISVRGSSRSLTQRVCNACSYGRRGTLSLLAQLCCFLGKAFFKGGSLCETTTLWHTLLHPLRIGGSATGVLITDNCQETGR